MRASDVRDLCRELDDLGIAIWLDGGWAVDALLGKQTRPHADLDIVVERKNVSRLCYLLKNKDYKRIPRDDTSAWCFALGDSRGRRVHIHVISFFDDAGDGIYGPVEAGMTYPVGSLSGKGTIDGYAVNCVAPQQLVKFHLGYKLHRNDFLDVRALCEKFNIEMPDEQKAYWNPVLKRFRAALDEIYGDRIERVVLFGSRARGDAREDSDYDVAVFLKDPTDRGSELNRLADLGTNILDETGEFIHAMAYRADSYNNERIPLMHEIRAHGIDL